MTALQFTPGPWSVYWHHSHLRGEPYQVTGADGERITRLGAFIKPTSDRAVANANLIAAAPDLYKYLALASKIIEQSGIVWMGIDGANAALAKARGEQQ